MPDGISLGKLLGLVVITMLLLLYVYSKL